MNIRPLFYTSLSLFAAIAVLGIAKRAGLWGRLPSTVETEAVKPAAVEQASSAPQRPAVPPDTSSWPRSSDHLPGPTDRLAELFDPTQTPLPIVEAIRYTPNASWSPHRAAWLGDYAAHFSTSKHFISRSLARNSPQYDRQNIAVGDRFNVLKKDKPFEFYLIVDTSRARLWFYYRDPQAGEDVLLKTYDVGLGRFSSSSISGSLTPLGKFRLGSKIAVYRPGALGVFKRREVEMIQVFGTRWMPLEGTENKTVDLKGYGIHGTPWSADAGGKLAEDLSGVGSYSSDGCIRMATADVEELFSIVVTRPTTVEIVADFAAADLHSRETPPAGNP